MQNELVVAGGEVGGGLSEIGDGIKSILTVLSTEPYRDLCRKSLFYTPERNITLYSNYTGTKRKR